MPSSETQFRPTHGETCQGRRTTEYYTWVNIRVRCGSPGAKDYPRYGARGIRVCERWQNSYENFLADMGRKPGPGYSIDRINNDGHYEPSNCRWATWNQQASNRSTSGLLYGRVMLRLQESGMDCTDISEVWGVSVKSVYKVMHYIRSARRPPDTENNQGAGSRRRSTAPVTRPSART